MLHDVASHLKGRELGEEKNLLIISIIAPHQALSFAQRTHFSFQGTLLDNGVLEAHVQQTRTKNEQANGLTQAVDEVYMRRTNGFKRLDRGNIATDGVLSASCLLLLGRGVITFSQASPSWC